MSEVTRILSAIEQGDSQAAAQLLPLVYDELRRLAAAKLAQENPGQTLEATALVHEAYLKLVDVETQRHWKSRSHFFACAAEAMRHLLVDRARQKRGAKRGGQRIRVDLDEATLAAAQDSDEVLAVDEALAQLSVEQRVAVVLVDVQGWSVAEVARLVGVPPGTVKSRCARARTRLAELLGHLREEHR